MKLLSKPPTQPGAYRLYTYVFDGKGHAAHANIPFYVDRTDGKLRQDRQPINGRAILTALTASNITFPP